MDIGSRRLLAAGALVVVGTLVSAPPLHAKRPPAPEPDLQILNVTLSPDPYDPGEGTAELAVEVELPASLDGKMLLEVSSLISSPSKRSVRFLFIREPVAFAAADGARRRTVTLTWDGTDQNAQLVSQGRYAYEVKAKLLAVSDKGPRTLMQSWPKRGIIDVK